MVFPEHLAPPNCVRALQPKNAFGASLDRPAMRLPHLPQKTSPVSRVEFGLKSLVRLQVDERFVRLDGDSVFIGHDPGCDDAEDSTTAVDLLGSSGDVLADEDR